MSGEDRRAVADAVNAVRQSRHLSARALRGQVGMPSSTWQNYFVACSRDVPLGTFREVCAALGVDGSAVLAMAEGAGDPPRVSAPGREPEPETVVVSGGDGVRVTVEVRVTKETG